MPDQIPNQIIATSKRYKCRHIFLDGHRCGSPSLRREEFCYYHHTTRGAAADLRDRRARMCEFELPPLEDRSSVLAAIAEVLQRIAACAIDNKRAGLLLYGLQIASLNLPQPVDAEHDDQPIEEVIADPRFGDLAPIAEIPEPATVEAQPTNSGAPCPASGTWGSTPPTQLESDPESESEPIILSNLQASAPFTLPIRTQNSRHLDRSAAQWRDPCISPLPVANSNRRKIKPTVTAQQKAPQSRGFLQRQKQCSRG
jgi:hypothetical protein